VTISLLFGNISANASGTPEPQQFLDTARGTYLIVHANPSDQSYGDFSFSVKGLGSYVGHAKQFIQLKVGGGVVINYNGEAAFFSEAGLQDSRNVVINIQTGPNIGYATTVLNDLTNKKNLSYLLISQKPRQDAKQTVIAVGEALKGKSWSVLFGLVSSTFTDGKTVDEFAANLASQELELGHVVSYDILSEPNVQFSPLGVWFFTVKARYIYNKNGTNDIVEKFDYYVYEGSNWKFWFSANE